MRCSRRSLNAGAWLQSSFPKYTSDFHALRSLISLCFGRANPEWGRASPLAIHLLRGIA